MRYIILILSYCQYSNIKLCFFEYQTSVIFKKCVITLHLYAFPWLFHKNMVVWMVRQNIWNIFITFNPLKALSSKIWRKKDMCIKLACSTIFDIPGRYSKFRYHSVLINLFLITRTLKALKPPVAVSANQRGAYIIHEIYVLSQLEYFSYWSLP